MTVCPNCGSEYTDEFKFCPQCGTMVPGAGATQKSLVGSTISNKYRILSKIGSGAMGTVYLGEHLGIHKKVALKVLHSDLNVNDELLQRFQQEGIAAGKFTHPNAIQIFDFDKDVGNVFYLAMEYVEGTTLQQLIKDQGPQSVKKSIHILKQILSALSEAHKEGIIHRDLKPENVMVTDPESEKPSVKVLDFGISKLRDLGGTGQALKTQTGRIMGTPLYMAPEQFSGDKVDHRCDIYASGLVLFELLAGARPFQADTVNEILFKQAMEETPSLHSVHPDLKIPKGLEEIVHKAANKKQDERYQTSTEMIDALSDLDFGVIAKGKPKPRGSSKGPSHLPKIMIGLVVVALAVAAGIFLPGIFEGMKKEPDVLRVSLKANEALTQKERQYLSLLAEVRTKLATRDTATAISLSNQALLMDCRDSEGYLLRGHSYVQKNDLDTARPDYEEALKLDPDYVEAVNGLGVVHLKNSELDAALARFQQAREMDPTLADAFVGEGMVQYQKESLDEAEKSLSQAIQLDPRSGDAHLFLGRIYRQQNDLEKASASFIEAKRYDPSSFEAYVSIGEIYDIQGQTERADQHFRDALKLKKDSIRAQLGLASILLDAKRFEEANTIVLDAKRVHPDNPRPHTLLGIIAFQKNSLPEARGHFQKAIDLKETDPQAFRLLGILKQRDGLYNEAIKLYRLSLSESPDHPATFQNIGTCLMKLERFEEARDALDKSVMLDPKSTFTHYALGILYMDYLEEPELAKEHLTHYRRLGGSDNRVNDWIERL